MKSQVRLEASLPFDPEPSSFTLVESQKPAAVTEPLAAHASLPGPSEPAAPSSLPGVGDRTPDLFTGLRLEKSTAWTSGVRSPDLKKFPQTQPPVDESRWPSRKQKRKGLRLDPQQVLKAQIFCATRGIYLKDLVNELLRAFNLGTVPVIPGLGDRTPESADLIDHQTMTKEDEIDQLSSSSSDSSICSGRPDVQTFQQDAENGRIEEIIAFYEVTTGTPHTPRDIEAVRSVFDLSDNVINTGILRSVIYCSERVGSFKYCLKAIRQISKSRIDPREEFSRMYETFFAKVRGGQLVLPGEGAAFLEGKFGKK